MSDFRVPHLNVRKISPNHLNDFEKEVTDIHYDPVTPVHHTFKKIEDPLDYEDMETFRIYTLRQSPRHTTLLTSL